MLHAQIKLSVIILFYQGESWVDKCVGSLIDQTLSGDLYEIILVDNGGSTPSVDKYKKQKNIKIIHFPVNYGFAEGNNKSMEYADGEIVLLMNQDVLVQKDCLQYFLTAFENKSNPDVCSANMFSISVEDRIDRSARFSGRIGYFILSKFGYASYRIQHAGRDLFPVEVVSGNALSFRKNMLKDIGNYLFDARLGSYAEDLDFSLRIKNKGLKMYVVPEAIVYHYRDQAFSGSLKHLVGKLFHVSYNRLIVYYNNLTRKEFLKRLPLLLIGFPLKVAKLDTERRPNMVRFIAACFIFVLALPYFGARIIQQFFYSKRV